MTLPDDKVIEAMILAMIAERGSSKTVCPSEVARALAGSNEKAWRRLMTPIRRVAVRLADEDRVALRRKGRPVDSHDFKGIYRIGLPATDQGAGNSASVLPVNR